MSDQIRITINEIEEINQFLYERGVLVITEAGIRLTWPFLRGYMKNPQILLEKVVEICETPGSSRVDNNSSKVARAIVESVCFLLVGSKSRKWLSLEDVISRLVDKGYVVSTITTNVSE